MPSRSIFFLKRLSAFSSGSLGPISTFDIGFLLRANYIGIYSGCQSATGPVVALDLLADKCQLSALFFDVERGPIHHPLRFFRLKQIFNRGQVSLGDPAAVAAKTRGGFKINFGVNSRVNLLKPVARQAQGSAGTPAHARGHKCSLALLFQIVL